MRNALEAAERTDVLAEAAAILDDLAGVADGQTGYWTLLTQKGDLSFMHWRRDLESLRAAELTLAQTRLRAYLLPTYSYLSVIELGTYELSGHAASRLKARSVEPTEEALQEEMKQLAKPRLYPKDPRAPLRLLLSDVEATRRARQLVRPSCRRARGHDARPRRDRTEVRRDRDAGDLGLGRSRRLGVGRRSLRRRPARVHVSLVRRLRARQRVRDRDAPPAPRRDLSHGRRARPRDRGLPGGGRGCPLHCRGALDALTNVYLATGRRADAEAYLRRFTRDHPEHPDGPRHLARVRASAPGG